MDIHDLAVEVAMALGSDDDKDVAEVQDWLLTNDDGAAVEQLADRFDMEVGLPTRRDS